MVTIHLAFTQQPGSATDIGVGANGQIWAIGTNQVPGGYGIYKFNGSSWDNVPGGAVRIAVSSNDTPMVINDAGQIFVLNGENWQEVPGSASDIAMGADGSIWAIGTNPVPGGYGIYKWNGSSWDNVPGGAVRIAVRHDGTPMVINDVNNIFISSGDPSIGNWQQLPGSATHIAADRRVWVLGNQISPGGYDIFYWNDSNWAQVEGEAVSIAVSNEAPYVVNTASNIFWATEFSEVG